MKTGPIRRAMSRLVHFVAPKEQEVRNGVTFEGNNPIYLDYPAASVNEPRWGYGKPAHPLLYNIIDRGRKNYERLLCSFFDYKEKYLEINRFEDEQMPWEPHLTTPWLPGLDSLALYSMLAIHKPAKYVERIEEMGYWDRDKARRPAD